MSKLKDAFYFFYKRLINIQLFSKLILFTILLFSQIANAQNVTIDGSAFLEFQSNHSGIKIYFERTAPSMFTDSTFTDSTGHFSISIPTGIYNLIYSKNNYINANKNNNLFFADSTLTDTTLESLGLYGNINGILGPGIFKVGDTLTVAAGDSLIILPGTTLLFKANKSLIVNGYISANGLSTDSIIFSKYDSTNWAGIVLNINLNSTGSISFAEVKFADIGLASYRNTSQLSNLYLHDNFLGLELYCLGAGNTFRDFLIENNTNNSDHTSAGVRVVGGQSDTVQLINFRILNNINLYNISNGVGGLYLAAVNIKLINSIVAGNQGHTGGIYFESSQGGLEVRNCLIANNQGSQYNCAGGIYYDGYVNPIRLFNSNISYNHASSDPTTCGGVMARSYRTPEVRSSNFFGNNPTDYCSDSMTFINYAVMLNSNGDSCDVYSNIRIEPEFIDTLQRDYHFNATSKLVDAGMNNYVFNAFDLDGNTRIMDGDFNTTYIVDIGPYEAPGPVGILSNVSNLISQEFYPNPITSEIVFMGDHDIISLTIYNLSSQIVLEDKFIKNQKLNLAFLKPGIYFGQITRTNGIITVVKMIRQ